MVYVTSNTYPSLKEQVRVTIVGRSEYEGAADSLYLEYINAQMYVLKMQNGEIVIDVSSDNVPASKQWITQTLADSLVAETTAAKQLLEQHEQTPVEDNVLEKAERTLNTALRNFERALKKGTYCLLYTSSSCFGAFIFSNSSAVTVFSVTFAFSLTSSNAFMLFTS